MKPVNDLISNPQDLLSRASSSEQTSKLDKSGLTQRQRKLVSALWARMTQLFKHKWESTEGPMLDADRHSDAFCRWCAKTNGLTDQEWAKGMAKVERKIVADNANGNEPWPPSDVEFVSYCKPTISPDGNNSTAYLDIHDPKHPRNDPNSVDYCPQPKGLEDLTKKSRVKQKGRDTLNDLKNLF